MFAEHTNTDTLPARRSSFESPIQWNDFAIYVSSRYRSSQDWRGHHAYACHVLSDLYSLEHDWFANLHDCLATPPTAMSAILWRPYHSTPSPRDQCLHLRDFVRTVMLPSDSQRPDANDVPIAWEEDRSMVCREQRRARMRAQSMISCFLVIARNISMNQRVQGTMMGVLSLCCGCFADSFMVNENFEGRWYSTVCFFMQHLCILMTCVISGTTSPVGILRVVLFVFAALGSPNVPLDRPWTLLLVCCARRVCYYY